MAKRSDFAQKLLDDLRLRKERMASSQTSNQSQHLPTDAYAYTKQAFRGFRNAKANENPSSITGEMLNRRRHRSVNTGELSNQIIPYGKGQSSDHMSQALASAFENGGKPRRGNFSYTDAIMGFLHQIKRGSNLDRQVASIRHSPTLSLAQINEISKGAQKLNHILRASSDGLSMDTYSFQFAKELLQGAIDLEDSLRMLVDMQKSSEFLITRQGQNKSRIILLEEENGDGDGDDDKGMENSAKMQLARPTFSFDNPSRNAQKTIFVQRPITDTSTKEVRSSNRDNKNVKIQGSSGKKSSSSSSSSDISKQKSQMASNPEKGRIPNVIAKLMGLDNLPQKVEMESKHMHKKDLGNTQKVEGYQGMTSKHTAKCSDKKTEFKNKQTENLTPMAMAMKNQKVVETFKIPPSQDEELMMFGALLQKASSEGVAQNGKPLLRNLEGIKALNGFDKATTKIDKHDKSSPQTDAQMIGRKQDQPNHSNREQRGTAKGRTNDPVLSSMLAQLDQVHKISEVKNLIRVEKEISGSIIPPEKRHTSKHMLNNEKKSRNHLGAQKSYILSKNGTKDEKHHREPQLQRREEYMLMMRPQGGSEMTTKNSSKSPQQLINPQKKHPSINQAPLYKKNSGENISAMKSEGFLGSHYDDHDQVRDEESNDKNEKLKETTNNRKLGQIFSPREREFEQAKGKHGVKTLKDEKHVHKLAIKKINHTRKLKADMPGKVDQMLTGRNGTKLITEQGKQQISSLQETRFNVLSRAEKESVSMSREADAGIICSNELETETVAETEPLKVRLEPHKEAELLPTLYCCGGGELKSQQESVASLANDLHYQDVKSVAANLQDQAALFAAGEGFKTGEIASHITNGIQEGRMGVKYHSQFKDHSVSKISIQEPLTESEKCLKLILVMCPSFVSTAEALFRLNIPVSVLQGGDGLDIQDEGSKLKLDCGYEVMKRKGIRQELKVHTCSKILMRRAMNIRSLDDLVRQLNEDMEKLKFYGRKRNSQVEVDDDYLPKMLEHDVYDDKDPDINCMWDLGWNSETFAFIEKYDVIRDTEKHILSVLLDEITAGCMLKLRRGMNMNDD